MTNVADSGTNGITLLPCPFCGGEAHAHEFSMHLGQFACHMFLDPYWQVICSECRAAIGDFNTRAEAIEAWNTRSVTAAAVMGYQAAQAERTCKFKPLNGEDLEEQNSVRGVCSECSALMHGKDSFCPNCGAKVVEQ